METYFHGITLAKAGDTVNFSGVQDDAENKLKKEVLLVTQALLGHTAKAGEYNVVEVETKSLGGSAKIPIAVLKAGETRCITLNLEFPDSVTFRLIEGNGPVYILGQHIPMVNKNEGELSDEEYISEEEGEQEDEPQRNGKKKPKANHK